MPGSYVIKDLATVDPDSLPITIRVGKPNPNGKGRSMWINCDDKTLAILTPKTRAPFGVSKFEETANKWDVSLNVDADTPEMTNLVAIIQRIENDIIEHVFENQSSYFKGEPVSKEVITSRFTKMLKTSASYPTKITGKVYERDGLMQCAFFNSAKEQVEHSDIQRGDTVRALIEIGPSCWVMDKSFGCIIKAVQVRSFGEGGDQDMDSGGCMIDDDEDQPEPKRAKLEDPGTPEPEPQQEEPEMVSAAA